MKFIFALLTVPLVLAASSDPLQQLTDLAAAGNGVISLDSKTFDLLTSSTRNWSASIQLTALDRRRRCTPCFEFDPAWNAVAASWANVPKQHRNQHFFATLDFDNGQAVFQSLGLQSAPVVYVYPAARGPRAPSSGKLSPSKYDFSNGYDAAPLAESLSKHTPVPIPYKDPIDWARYFAIAFGLLVFVTVIRYISPILQNRWVWAFATILMSLVMTSGYMFTRIRNSPFSGGGGNWIAAGFQSQFGQEVSVVATMYGLLSLSFLMLVMVVPYQTSSTRQRLQVYLWSGVFVLVYSILISLFRVKNRGYPFKLFL